MQETHAKYVKEDVFGEMKGLDFMRRTFCELEM